MDTQLHNINAMVTNKFFSEYSDLYGHIRPDSIPYKHFIPIDDRKTVKDLKVLIVLDFDVPVDDQILEYCNRELENYEIIGDVIRRMPRGLPIQDFMLFSVKGKNHKNKKRNKTDDLHRHALRNSLRLRES